MGTVYVCGLRLWQYFLEMCGMWSDADKLLFAFVINFIHFSNDLLIIIMLCILFLMCIDVCLFLRCRAPGKNSG